MEESVSNFVKEAFKGRKLEDVNKTLLVLIPKIEKPKFTNQFKPIFLCNVMYKCVTRIIVNRLKSMLSHLI